MERARRVPWDDGLSPTVNRAQATPLVFDYTVDANGHPENIYCRSDHYNDARDGIPVVLLPPGCTATISR